MPPAISASSVHPILHEHAGTVDGTPRYAFALANVALRGPLRGREIAVQFTASEPVRWLLDYRVDFYPRKTTLTSAGLLSLLVPVNVEYGGGIGVHAWARAVSLADGTASIAGAGFVGIAHEGARGTSAVSRGVPPSLFYMPSE